MNIHVTVTFIITLQTVHQVSSDVQMDSASQQPCDVMVCFMVAQMEVMNLAAVSNAHFIGRFTSYRV